jgi:hypothetical protein
VFRLRSGILIASKALGKRIPAETSSAILLTGDHLALLTDKGPKSATSTTLPACRAAFSTPDAMPDRDFSTVPKQG